MYDECKQRAESARDWWLAVNNHLADDDFGALSALLTADGYDVDGYDTAHELLSMLLAEDVLEVRLNGSRSLGMDWETTSVEWVTGLGGPTVWLTFENEGGAFTVTCRWSPGEFVARGFAPELAAVAWEQVTA